MCGYFGKKKKKCPPQAHILNTWSSTGDMSREDMKPLGSGFKAWLRFHFRFSWALTLCVSSSLCSPESHVLCPPTPGEIYPSGTVSHNKSFLSVYAFLRVFSQSNRKGTNTVRQLKLRPKDNCNELSSQTRFS